MNKKTKQFYGLAVHQKLLGKRLQNIYPEIKRKARGRGKCEMGAMLPLS